MGIASIPTDTDPEVFDRQVERWRTMTLVERLTLIEELHLGIEALALAGIAAQHPDLSEVGIRHELASRRYGRQLAAEAYRHLLD